MKLLLPILLFTLFAGQAIAQPGNKPGQIYNIWIGPNAEYLDIHNDSVYFATAFYRPYGCMLNYDGGTLSLTLAGEHQAFRVVSVNDDTLRLKAKDNNGYGLVRTWDTIVFVNRKCLYDSALTFGQLRFYRSGSGMLPAEYSNIQFQIDSTGALLFSCVPQKGKYNGTYKGQLSASQLKQLTDLLKASALDRFVIPLVHLTDVPGYGFKFYYDHKMKEAYGQGMPYPAVPLVDYLNTLINAVQLEKISDEFDLKW